MNSKRNLAFERRKKCIGQKKLREGIVRKGSGMTIKTKGQKAQL